MHPLERLINLVALLLEAPRPLTFEHIREVLPAYAQDDVATAKRMFERDKDILRDNGVPVELAPLDPLDVEEGYTIPKGAYYLPEIAFSPQEISALFVAAQSGGDDTGAERAVRKLLYGAEGGVLTGLEPGPLTLGPDVEAGRLTAAAEAVLGARSVSFGYTTSRGVASERRVDAFGLVWRAGNWYLVGQDQDRQQIRAFRLSRMSTDVADVGKGREPPEGFRAADHIDVGSSGSGEQLGTATIALSPDVAWWAVAGLAEAVVDEPDGGGWVRVHIPMGATDVLASWVLSFGPDARVESPDSLREDVLQRLEAVLGG